MLKHILVRTKKADYDFWNAQSFTFDKETHNYMILSQNNDLHCFPRENVISIVI
jgi:hypothetical protein